MISLETNNEDSLSKTNVYVPGLSAAIVPSLCVDPLPNRLRPAFYEVAGSFHPFASTREADPEAHQLRCHSIICRRVLKCETLTDDPECSSIRD